MASSALVYTSAKMERHNVPGLKADQQAVAPVQQDISAKIDNPLPIFAKLHPGELQQIGEQAGADHTREQDNNKRRKGQNGAEMKQAYIYMLEHENGQI